MRLHRSISRTLLATIIAAALVAAPLKLDLSDGTLGPSSAVAKNNGSGHGHGHGSGSGDSKDDSKDSGKPGKSDSTKDSNDTEASDGDDAAGSSKSSSKAKGTAPPSTESTVRAAQKASHIAGYKDAVQSATKADKLAAEARTGFDEAQQSLAQARASGKSSADIALAKATLDARKQELANAEAGAAAAHRALDLTEDLASNKGIADFFNSVFDDFLGLEGSL